MAEESAAEAMIASVGYECVCIYSVYLRDGGAVEWAGLIGMECSARHCEINFELAAARCAKALRQSVKMAGKTTPGKKCHCSWSQAMKIVDGEPSACISRPTVVHYLAFWTPLCNSQGRMGTSTPKRSKLLQVNSRKGINTSCEVL